MMKPTVPENEAERLAALRSYGVLDTPPERAFDDLTRLASRLCGAPISLVSLVDAGRQWFKARVGLDVPETPRDVSFCGHAILGAEPFVVPDAARDERFADNPLVTGDMHVRFYAGVPLVDQGGHALGALCVMDRVPRELSAEELDGLRTLARQAMNQLELRLAVSRLSETLTDRRHAEGALLATHARLMRQNAALVGLAQQGVTTEADLGAAARAVTEAGARTLRVARASVWLYDEARTLIRCLDLFEAEAAKHGGGLELKREQFPAYFAAMEAERTIVAHDARTDPRTAEFTECYLKPLGITSMLDSPIRVGGRVVGVLCMEHVGPVRHWAVDEQSFAASLTNLFAVAYEAAGRRRSDERYRLVNRATNDAIWDWDLVTGTLAWNDAIGTTFGYVPAEVPGTIDFWVEHLHPEDRARVSHGIHAVIDGGREYWADEYRFRRADGGYAQVFDRGFVTRDEGGRAVRMIGAMQDVTERRRAEDRLREETQVTEALYRVGRTVAAELDLEKVVQAVADEGVRVTRARFGAFFYVRKGDRGRGEAQQMLYAVSGLPRETFAKFAVPRETAIFAPTFAGQGVVRHEDVTKHEDFGKSAPYHGLPPGHPPVRSYLAAPVVSRTGEVLGAIFFGHESAGVFTERDERLAEGIASQAAIAIDNARLFASAKQAGERMAYQASHDGLTGLPNRLLFLARVDACLQRSTREPEKYFAVLFLDLDRFKVVNDSLGHAAGDRLLTEVSSRLTGCVRACDAVSRAAQCDEGAVVARMGGDEFTVLLEGLAKPEDAARVAERVLSAVARPVEFDGHEVTTTVSIGIVVGGPRYASAREVLRDADAAMYKAKESGKNRYAIFDETLHAAAVARLRMENELRRAPERGELLLMYQPIVSLQTRQLVGFEALVRWRRDGKMMSPAEFIPVAEDTGLIVPLGAWVMREACRQLAEWRRRFGGTASGRLTVSVNLSRRQLGDPGLLATLGDALKSSGVDPEGIKLEITESAIMADPDGAWDVLSAIKAHGVLLSMDDFGTGYSSLSCLHRFPLDELKVDRSFVTNFEGRRDAAAVLQAVVALAHNLGLSVVAEGLETVGQIAFLQAIDCDLGQGYYFAKPLEAAAAERMVAEHAAGGTAAALPSESAAA